MPQIIVQAHTPDCGIEVVTLAERAIPTDQQNDHYVAQLMERVGWALLDAEQLESQTNMSDPDGAGARQNTLDEPPGCSDARPRQAPARTHAARREAEVSR